MTPEEVNAVCRRARSTLIELDQLCNYYFRRYHDTRRALIGCRLDKIELEAMVESLQKQLGDKGLDINLGNDIPDVR